MPPDLKGNHREWIARVHAIARQFLADGQQSAHAPRGPGGLTGYYRGELFEITICYPYTRNTIVFTTTIKLIRPLDAVNLTMATTLSTPETLLPDLPPLVGPWSDSYWTVRGAPVAAVRALITPQVRAFVDRMGQYVCQVHERPTAAKRLIRRWQGDPARLRVDGEGASMFLYHAVLDPALYAHIADWLIAIAQQVPAAMQYAYQQPGGPAQCAVELQEYERRIDDINRGNLVLHRLVALVALLVIVGTVVGLYLMIRR
jgi:hypothetical protein